MSKKVLVWVETQPQGIGKAALAAVAFGQQYCQQFGYSLQLALCGEHAEQHSAQLTQFGAEKVYFDNASWLTPLTNETVLAFLSKAAQHADASMLLAASSSLSKDCLPRFAARWQAGMASEVLRAESENRFKRPMWAGNLLATVELTTPKRVLTVRASECGSPNTVSQQSACEPIQSEPLGQTRTQQLQFKAMTSNRPDLATADRVISGGRGVKSREGFKIVEELADALGAAVGASRAVCDAGWVPNDLQVGQTGKIVAPQLYVALGISGAIQHLAGMKGSKTIVAINKDADAPIFQVADYGLVGDLFAVVPEWISILQHGK